MLVVFCIPCFTHNHSMLPVERPMETYGWLLTYYATLSKMLGEEGLFSSKEEGTVERVVSGKPWG